MAEELLKKIPPEKLWEITSKILSAFFVIRGEKLIAPILGRTEGFISPLWSSEKWTEINTKVFGDGGRQLCSLFKEMFNISVKDCIEANKLLSVATMLQQGPENEGYYVEKPQKESYTERLRVRGWRGIRNLRCPLHLDLASVAVQLGVKRGSRQLILS